MYFVKFRNKGQKRFWYVTPRIKATKKKDEAVSFYSFLSAAAFINVAREESQENQNLDFKIVRS